jgi:hypothetical protein
MLRIVFCINVSYKYSYCWVVVFFSGLGLLVFQKNKNKYNYSNSFSHINSLLLLTQWIRYRLQVRHLFWPLNSVQMPAKNHSADSNNSSWTKLTNCSVCGVCTVCLLNTTFGLNLQNHNSQVTPNFAMLLSVNTHFWSLYPLNFSL